MPESSTSLVAKPTSANGSSFHNAPCLTGLLSPAQARAYLNHLTNDQLADLVRTGRLPALRDPIGRLCFSVSDLDAIPKAVSSQVAADELERSKDLTMTNAMMVPPSEATNPPTTGDQVAHLIKNTFDELRRYLARGPKWVDVNDGESIYAVPGKTIKEWARQGFVRKAKLGPTFQSRTVYSAEDLHDVLCRTAVGKSPILALHKEN